MVENFLFFLVKGVRKLNFIFMECIVMVKYIKSKFMLILMNKNKIRVWDEIINKVNVLGICKRSVMEVKDKWCVMVSFVKKEYDKCVFFYIRRSVGEDN